jgi:1,3-beta-glucanosyltransferase GAS3
LTRNSYQPGGESGFNPTSGQDVLSDANTCLRDAVVLQQLGVSLSLYAPDDLADVKKVNTIRVYNVNPTTNHDDCMSIFNAAGIYLIIDVNTPQDSINRDSPATTYTAGYLEFIFSQVENFKGYPNVLAFFAGNEIINDVTTAAANPPYIRVGGFEIEPLFE